MNDASGLVQMSNRYYSEEIGQFVSPDGLFLERPDLCGDSPIECNLYSYSRNNPLKFIDPEGTDAILPTPIRENAQFWNDLKGMMKAYWTVFIDIPYKVTGSLTPGFDAVTAITGKDVSDIASFDNFMSRKSGIEDASGFDQVTSRVGFLAKPLSTAARMTKVASGLKFLEGGMTEKIMSSIWDFASGVEKLSNIVDSASDIKNAVQATSQSVESFDKIQTLTIEPKVSNDDEKQ